MAEFVISGFIIILFSSIGIKYLYDSCKKEPIENIIRASTESVILRNENVNENDVPPKYEEVPPTN